MTRMVRKQLYLESRQDELLKEAARSTGMTESELIRRAIDATYDPAAARSQREAAWERFHSAAEDIAELVRETGGLRPWNRDGLHERRT